MLRIGVVSDSHGDLYMLDKAVSLMGKIELLLHLGDHYRDIIKLNSKYNYNIDYIVGNNDFAGNIKSEKLILANNKRILLTHGHKYNVNNGFLNLKYKAEEEMADIVLYGHTHKYSLEYVNNTLFLNPGSVSRPRDRNSSAAILDIDSNGEVNIKKIIIEY
jgi:uncharacterized protein